MLIREQQIKKTRKAHQCWGCGQRIDAGSSMLKSISIDEDGIHSDYWCQPCLEYIDTLDPEDAKEISFGEIGDMRKAC